jgi:hypothetical protein
VDWAEDVPRAIVVWAVRASVAVEVAAAVSSGTIASPGANRPASEVVATAAEA